LFVSEDGISFRPVGERPYIDLGGDGELDSRQVRMSGGFITRGNEVWQYYAGHQTGHTLARGARPRGSSTIMRAVQRRDGFACLTAGPREGVLTTVPLEVTGSELLVNCDAGAWGEVSIELLDPSSGDRIPSYSVSDTIPLFGDSIYGRVPWSDARSLQPLRGRKARLRFLARNARVFSFGFSDGAHA
jgi:hypothetical protein